jgi:hypothetical protein
VSKTSAEATAVSAVLRRSFPQPVMRRREARHPRSPPPSWQSTSRGPLSAGPSATLSQLLIRMKYFNVFVVVAISMARSWSEWVRMAQILGFGSILTFCPFSFRASATSAISSVFSIRLSRYQFGAPKADLFATQNNLFATQTDMLGYLYETRCNWRDLWSAGSAMHFRLISRALNQISLSGETDHDSAARQIRSAWIGSSTFVTSH